MFTLPNFLSLLRIPLAFAFLYHSTQLRFIAVVLAAISDSADGFIARHQRQASQLGAMLDPLTDKFFMLFALTALLFEGQLSGMEMTALLSRDIAVATFGIYLGLSGGWASYKLRALWCGKASTALQFMVLGCLLIGVTIHSSLYSIFIVLGVFALGELYLIRRWQRRSEGCA